MRLTEALKKHMQSVFGVAATATDDEYRAAIGKAVGEGKLTAKQIEELSVEPPTPAQTQLKDFISTEVKQAIAGLNLTDQIKAAMQGLLPAAPPPAPAPTAENKGNNGTPPPAPPPAPTPPTETKDINLVVKEAVEAALKAAGQIPQEKSANYLLSRGQGEAHDLKVKKATDRYTHVKSQLVYPMKSPLIESRGQPVTYMERPVESLSQRDKAVIGVYTKWLFGVGMKNPGFQMTEHENDILEYAIREMPWTGYVGTDGDSHKGSYVADRKLADFEQKTLLWDATSGGIYAVPTVYDNAIIEAPIFAGELFPLVNVQPIARGRTIHAFSAGTPVISSGPEEGTAIPLLDTTNFISGLDTTIYPCTGSIEIGLDFEDDSPPDWGAYVIRRYNEKHAEWLDEQLAVGDGTTEPLGIFNTGTATIVPSVNGSTGPVTIADLESLIFGMNIAYRRNLRGGRLVFVMNDNTYRRFRQIATMTTSNERLFGTDYQNYELLGIPVRIVPVVPNNKIAMVNFAYYRMYRRQGLNVKVETGGRELSLKNLKLIVVRALWGGRIEQGGALVIMQDAQA